MKKELQHFQGTWRFESLEENGAKVAADEVKERTFFVGADLFLIRRGTKILQAGNLQVDAGRNPKTVNAVVKAGEQKGEVMLGIYALDGDTLKMCFDVEGGERPKEFKSPAKSKRLLAVCKRVRPKNETVDIRGTYRSEALQEDGTKYIADATIDRLGDAYLVTYSKSTPMGTVTAYVAIGVRQGDMLSLAWANNKQIGVTIYRIEAGPRLIGQYTHLGGPGILSQETLTPAKRVLDTRLR